jgi:hypothetical protein
MGRYALASRMRLPGPQVFACRLQSISTQQLVASAPVPGQEGEAITVNFEPFGTLRGSVARLIDGGFSMEIDGGSEDDDKLARKIDWYKRRTFAGVTDKRRHRRFMPRDPRSAIVLHSGMVLPCLVIDISSSGAAISADYEPVTGEPLAVGRALGRVVRKLEVGFAVQFLEAFEIEIVEEMLRAPDDWQRAIEERAAMSRFDPVADLDEVPTWSLAVG